MCRWCAFEEASRHWLCACVCWPVISNSVSVPRRLYSIGYQNRPPIASQSSMNYRHWTTNIDRQLLVCATVGETQVVWAHSVWQVFWVERARDVHLNIYRLSRLMIGRKWCKILMWWTRGWSSCGQPREWYRECNNSEVTKDSIENWENVQQLQQLHNVQYTVWGILWQCLDEQPEHTRGIHAE